MIFRQPPRSRASTGFTTFPGLHAIALRPLKEALEQNGRARLAELLSIRLALAKEEERGSMTKSWPNSRIAGRGYRGAVEQALEARRQRPYGLTRRLRPFPSWLPPAA